MKSLRYGLASLGGVVCAAAVAAVTFWPTSAGGRPQPGSQLRLMFSGETFGELEPCNCSGEMVGGLPVRGGYIAQSEGPKLVVDVGCFGNGAREFEILRTQATLRGMKQMGYDAANMGEHELWLTPAELRDLTAFGVPLVSANVQLNNDENPEHQQSFKPFHTVQRAGLDIAITGVVDDAYTTGEGLTINPPREALARLLPQMVEHAGVIVVLADLQKTDAIRLVEEFPEITVMLFRGRGDSFGPEKINRSVVASVSGDTLYLGDMTLTWTQPHAVNVQGQIVHMQSLIPADIQVHRASIDWYKSAVNGRTFDLAEGRPGWNRISATEPEPGNGYVGSQACKQCHEYQYEKWSNAAHAHAMDSLVAVDYAYSPECVVCHVVGYGASDGYHSLERSKHLGNVGCESCHGPGEALLTGNCKGIAKAGTDSCVQCHTPKRHPDFEYHRHWAKIDHSERNRK